MHDLYILHFHALYGVLLGVEGGYWWWLMHLFCTRMHFNHLAAKEVTHAHVDVFACTVWLYHPY